MAPHRCEIPFRHGCCLAPPSAVTPRHPPTDPAPIPSPGYRHRTPSDCPSHYTMTWTVGSFPPAAMVSCHLIGLGNSCARSVPTAASAVPIWMGPFSPCVPVPLPPPVPALPQFPNALSAYSAWPDIRAYQHCNGNVLPAGAAWWYLVPIHPSAMGSLVRQARRESPWSAKAPWRSWYWDFCSEYCRWGICRCGFYWSSFDWWGSARWKSRPRSLHRPRCADLLWLRSFP